MMTSSLASLTTLVRWIAFACCSCSCALAVSAGPSIDAILSEEHARRSITASAVCSDEVFLRRITLDLAGRVPSLDEIRQFQADPNRAAKIDRLLESEEFAASWSETWTAMLVGYEDANDSDPKALRAWLENALNKRTPYDKIAQQLITARGQSALDGHVSFLLRHRDEPAVRVSRIFLGVRLDCARCHDHPFDRWTQADFESVSRFFDGMEIREVAERNMELFDRTENTRRVPKDALPRFFTSSTPKTAMWRDEFALFVTSCKPFARTYANRIWYQLMGCGIVATPDDFSRDNKPASRELLDFLTDKAREQRFDIRAMIRLICNSAAYQRQTASTANSPSEIELFAVRKIKPLTSEQLVDSIAQSLDMALAIDRREELIRWGIGDVDEDFSETHRYRESVQGLMMRLTLGLKSPTPSMDELFLRTLGRAPTDDDIAACTGFAIDDVAFALVNSSEFFFNH